MIIWFYLMICLISAHTKGYLAKEKLLPKAVIDSHKLSREEWEDKITSFHQQHRGTSR